MATECPLCHALSGNFAVVGERVYGGKPEQRFYECANCDVAFLYPRPTMEEEKVFYAKEFEQYMQGRSEEAGGMKWTT